MKTPGESVAKKQMRNPTDVMTAARYLIANPRRFYGKEETDDRNRLISPCSVDKRGSSSAPPPTSPATGGGKRSYGVGSSRLNLPKFEKSGDAEANQRLVLNDEAG